MFRKSLILFSKGMQRKKTVIIGGVAGGASVAARLRRLDENRQINVLERGPFVSFANCGLPYYVGNVIKDRSSLLVATPELFQDRFNINVFLNSNVLSIDRQKKEITYEKSGEKKAKMQYDELVIATGAKPIALPIKGFQRKGVFTVRSIPDVDLIKQHISQTQARSAVVVGGGFIGLEMAENLHRLGLNVTIIELASHLLPPLDEEMTFPLQAYIKQDLNINIITGDAVVDCVDSEKSSMQLKTKNGVEIDTDMCVLAIGVKPESDLARDAGLKLGVKNTIAVDAQMRTSDNDIYALGDVAQVEDFVTRVETNVPLAGPAQRQGRVVAEAILGGNRRFRGVQATAVLGIGEMTVATTGESQVSLERQRAQGKIDFDWGVVYVHPGSHAEYYPMATTMHLKLFYRQDNGCVLGAQAVGMEGVERRIDVLSMAIQCNATVQQLSEAELCYAPAYGSAKDPVNMAGMVATNAIEGLSPLASWNDVLDTNNVTPRTILDCRLEEEHAAQHIPAPNAHTTVVNIPLEQLRRRHAELPRDQLIAVHCVVGQRAHSAVRLLRQLGFDARNLSGGITTYQLLTKSNNYIVCSSKEERDVQIKRLADQSRTK